MHRTLFVGLFIVLVFLAAQAASHVSADSQFDSCAIRDSTSPESYSKTGKVYAEHREYRVCKTRSKPHSDSGANRTLLGEEKNAG